MTAMDYGRLSVASRSVGLAQACLDASVEYATQREAFGEKIGSFQMIKKLIADMACDVAAARALVRGSPRLRHGHGRDAGQLGREVLRRRGRQPGGPGGSGDLRRRGVQRRSTDQPLSQLRQAVADRRGVGQHPGAADRG